MRILLVHQNYPGQFLPLVPALLDRKGWQVAGIGEQECIEARHPKGPPRGLMLAGYKRPKPTPSSVHPQAILFDQAVRRGEAAAAAARALRERGFVPDLIYAHPAWGEAIFLREIFPGARQLHYLEYFWHREGGSIGFDPEFPPSEAHARRGVTGNAVQLLSLEEADWFVSPTRWQTSTFPNAFRERMTTLFDGIDTAAIRPNPAAKLKVGAQEAVLGVGDEVITFVARNLEPTRGIHRFLRALPDILARRPRAQVVIVGGTKQSYDPPAPGGGSWRDLLLAELGAALPRERVHFVGHQSRRALNAVLQVSKVHVYLTTPFVLSWSLAEALSAGCLIAASRTPPVEEFLRHEENALLFDFFDHEGLVETVTGALAGRPDEAALRAAARRTAVERLDLATVCLPAQLRLLEQVAATGRAGA